MSQGEPKRLNLLEVSITASNGTLATPKSKSQFLDPGSPLKSGEKSPRTEDPIDPKKYEQLSKICAQMKQKEMELSMKQDRVSQLQLRRQQLSVKLQELKSQAGAQQKQEVIQQGIQKIKTSLQKNNTLIETLQTEITLLVNEQKTKASTAEATISGLLKQSNQIDTQSSKIQKQTTLATNKLLELQTKALDQTRPVSAVPEELKVLEDQLQRKKLQLNLVMEERRNIIARVQQTTKSNSESHHAISHIHNLKDQIAKLESGMKQLVFSDAVLKLQRQVDTLRANQQAKYAGKIKSVNESTPPLPMINSKTRKEVEEKTQTFSKLEKQDKQLEKRQSEYRQQITRANSEIERLRTSSNLTPSSSSVQQPNTQRLTDLQNSVNSLKAQLRLLKQDEENLTKQQQKTLKETEALKKKTTKKEADGAAFDILKKEKQQLERTINQIKQQYIAFEKENKNQVPAKLIEGYRVAIEQKNTQLTLVRSLTVQNERLSVQLAKLREDEAKTWQQNPLISEFETRLKQAKQRIQSITLTNKQILKKNAQTTAKINEYKEEYPDFVFPTKKKGAKTEAKVETKQTSKTETKAELKLTAKVSNDSNKKTKKQVEIESPSPPASPPPAVEPQSKQPATSKSAKKKNKAGKDKQVIQIKEVVVVQQQPEEQQTNGKESNKKSKKQNVEVEFQKKVQSLRIESSPNEKQNLLDFERNILEGEAQKEKVVEEVQVRTSKKQSKKQKKKAVTEASKSKKVQNSSQQVQQILKTLPEGKQAASSDNLKSLFVPGVIILVLVIIFASLR